MSRTIKEIINLGDRGGHRGPVESVVERRGLQRRKGRRRRMNVFMLSTKLPLSGLLLLMIYILHFLKDPKLWELWYIPYYG